MQNLFKVAGLQQLTNKHNWRINWISRICFPPAFPNTRFCTITGCASGMWITVHSFLIVHLLTRQMFLKNGGRPISNWNDFSNRDLHVSLADSEEAQIGSWWRHELWMLNLLNYSIPSILLMNLTKTSACEGCGVELHSKLVTCYSICQTYARKSRKVRSWQAIIWWVIFSKEDALFE